MKLKEKLFSISNKIYRPPQEYISNGSKEVIGIKFSLVLLFVTLTGIIFGPIIKSTFDKTKILSPEIILPKSKFKVLYQDSSLCSDVIQKNSKCFGNPSNPLLWTSQWTMDDESHLVKTSERMGKTYWIGVEIGNSIQSEIKVKKVNNLFLRLINADYKIWVNGELYTSGELVLNYVYITKV